MHARSVDHLMYFEHDETITGGQNRDLVTVVSVLKLQTKSSFIKRLKHSLCKCQKVFNCIS
jgi:hypothetical protein